MLRLAIARSNACLEQGLRRGVSRQWQPQRVRQPLAARAYADARSPDKTVLPGSQSATVAGVPQPPVLEPTIPEPPKSSEIPPSETPKVPPTPAEVQSIGATAASPSTNTGNLPPTGTGTASTGPSSIPPPPPPKKRRSFRSFFLALIVLSALGYGGGVYYSLVNDNFHDFFTEYVPFGEDAVAYFEEREFRRRFPSSGASSAAKNWPQPRGENKVTIGRSSGVNARVADESSNAGSDLGQKGKHVSAVGDAKATASSSATSSSAAAKKPEAKDTTHVLKPSPSSSSSSSSAGAKPASSTSKSTSSTPAAPLVDHINVSEATEPVVQELVKMVNNIITAVNASPEASKYASTLQTAKGDLAKIIGEIKTLKDGASEAAESKIKASHTEFDNAAKELLKRLEGEMREQEARWREEFENERERLSQSYQQKLSTELDAAAKVAEQKNQNALVELEVALQKKFMDSVRSRVESERSGRLSKLNELSASVEELEQLTGQWNSVVDATLATQHLQVALAAVRAKLAANEGQQPTPFLHELVALKEVSRDNDVVSAAIASIHPAAYQRGVPAAAALIDRFRRVAAEVRKASLLPEDAGVASHVASAVLSRFMFQKKGERGLPAGDDVEATLARTEVLLEEGDLDSAAREMNALKGWAGVLSRDWVGECRRVLEVRQAIDVISTEARLQSLLVD